MTLHPYPFAMPRQFAALACFILAAPLANLTAASPPTETVLKEIVIVYKTHFDIGYTQLARDVCHQYRTEMADKVLEAIERNADQPKPKQFVWTLSGYPMSQILGPEQAPDRREKISRAIRSGNLAVHALAFSMHDETLEPEDLVRSLAWSSAIARAHDLPLPRDAKTTDVPGHSWILPTVLTHAGVRFFQMGGPLVNQTFGLPRLFWWEGPDGSRLLTLYHNDYGTERMPPKGWPSSAWLFLHMTADNEGPPPPNVVEADLNFYQQNAPGVKIRVGQLEHFADLVLAEKPELPVVRSDIPDPWIHGLLSHVWGSDPEHSATHNDFLSGWYWWNSPGSVPSRREAWRAMHACILSSLGKYLKGQDDGLLDGNPSTTCPRLVNFRRKWPWRGQRPLRSDRQRFEWGRIPHSGHAAQRQHDPDASADELPPDFQFQAEVARLVLLESHVRAK